MSGLLERRVAILTGGGRGLGRAIAEALVGEGACVIVADNATSTEGDGSDPRVAREAVEALGSRAIACTDSVSRHYARPLVKGSRGS